MGYFNSYEILNDIFLCLDPLVLVSEVFGSEGKEVCDLFISIYSVITDSY